MDIKYSINDNIDKSWWIVQYLMYENHKGVDYDDETIEIAKYMNGTIPNNVDKFIKITYDEFIGDLEYFKKTKNELIKK